MVSGSLDSTGLKCSFHFTIPLFNWALEFSRLFGTLLIKRNKPIIIYQSRESVQCHLQLERCRHPTGIHQNRHPKPKN